MKISFLDEQLSVEVPTWHKVISNVFLTNFFENSFKIYQKSEINQISSLISSLDQKCAEIFNVFFKLFLHVSKSQYFFPIDINHEIWETTKNKLKKYSVTKTAPTFHCLNKMLLFFSPRRICSLILLFFYLLSFVVGTDFWVTSKCFFD